MSSTKTLMMRYLPMMVTCEEADQFIDEYLAGELPRGQRLVFDWHIRLCTGCRSYLERYRRASELCREYFYGEDEEAGEDIPGQIVKGIIAARRATGK